MEVERFHHNVKPYPAPAMNAWERCSQPTSAETKTVCGLYDTGGRRPDPIAVERFGTLDYDSLEALLAAFLPAQGCGRGRRRPRGGRPGARRRVGAHERAVARRSRDHHRALRDPRGAPPERPRSDGPRRVRARGRRGDDAAAGAAGGGRQRGAHRARHGSWRDAAAPRGRTPRAGGGRAGAHGLRRPHPPSRSTCCAR